MVEARNANLQKERDEVREIFWGLLGGSFDGGYSLCGEMESYKTPEDSRLEILKFTQFVKGTSSEPNHRTFQVGFVNLRGAVVVSRVKETSRSLIACS